MVHLSDSKFALAIIVPIMVLELALTAYPILYSLYTSFTNMNIMTFSSGGTFIGLANYVEAMNDPLVIEAIGVSLLFTALVLSMSIPMAIGLGLLLNEDFPGRVIVRCIVLLPWFVSEFISGVTWRILTHEAYGTFNGILYSLRIIGQYQAWVKPDTALFMLSIAYVWHYAPFGAFFVLAALGSINPESYQAAKIDGAGAFRRFRSITLPHIRYSLIIVLILTTMYALTSFDIIYAMTEGGPGTLTQTLTWLLYREHFANKQYGYAAAVSFVLMILVIVIASVYFIILRRRRK